MKIRSLLYILILSGLISCQEKKEISENSGRSDTEKTKGTTNSGIIKDTIIAGDSTNSNPKVAEMIKTELTEKLLKNDLSSIPAGERKFYYMAFDLNNDKKDEYFVGFSSPYFCGTGGCSGYILNNDGTLINQFTVTDYPIYAASSKTGGWIDLIFNSKGTFYILKNKNGKYPSNPFVQEKWKGKITDKEPVILDIYNSKYPEFTF